MLADRFTTAATADVRAALLRDPSMNDIHRPRIGLRHATGAILLVAAIAPQAWAQAPAKGGTQAPTAGEGRSGKEVYDTVCTACHATGVLEAPKFGDAKRWKPLIAEGQRSLTRAAIKGVRQMPPRGGNPGLSDREIERAVVFMANAAGGSFKDPK